jgi:hypothetical protein
MLALLPAETVALDGGNTALDRTPNKYVHCWPKSALTKFFTSPFLTLRVVNCTDGALAAGCVRHQKQANKQANKNKQSNNQTIKQSNNQTIKQSNNQAINKQSIDQ